MSEGHDTPLSVLEPALKTGLGVRWIAHRVPFQRCPRSSSNLEQIADWLTKILVGVGLVQLGQISREGSRLVRFP